MTISVRLNDDEAFLIKNYVKMNNTTISDLVRLTIIKKIEDEYDLKAFNKALEEYKEDPTTYSLDEVEKELS